MWVTWRTVGLIAGGCGFVPDNPHSGDGIVRKTAQSHTLFCGRSTKEIRLPGSSIKLKALNWEKIRDSRDPQPCNSLTTLSRINTSAAARKRQLDDKRSRCAARRPRRPPHSSLLDFRRAFPQISMSPLHFSLLAMTVHLASAFSMILI